MDKLERQNKLYEINQEIREKFNCDSTLSGNDITLCIKNMNDRNLAEEIAEYCKTKLTGSYGYSFDVNVCRTRDTHQHDDILYFFR